MLAPTGNGAWRPSEVVGRDCDAVDCLFNAEKYLAEVPLDYGDVSQASQEAIVLHAVRAIQAELD